MRTQVLKISIFISLLSPCIETTTYHHLGRGQGNWLCIRACPEGLWRRRLLLSGKRKTRLPRVSGRFFAKKEDRFNPLSFIRFLFLVADKEEDSVDIHLDDVGGRWKWKRSADGEHGDEYRGNVRCVQVHREG